MKPIKSIISLIKHSQVTMMFISGLVVGLYGLNQFWSGYHDLDMAQNLIFLRDDIQLELWKNNIPFTLGTYEETTTDGSKISTERLYYNGVLRLKASMPMMIFGFFTMGYYFRRIGG